VTEKRRERSWRIFFGPNLTPQLRGNGENGLTGKLI
jgi:hypothetical protein